MTATVESSATAAPAAPGTAGAAGAAEAIRVIGLEHGTEQTAQTPGMRRRELLATERAWVGTARTQPGVTSGWHHHGDYETFITVQAGRIRMEYGAGGRESSEAGPGELLVVPRGAVHRESNPGDVEQLVLLVRVGSGEPVFNVAGPAD